MSIQNTPQRSGPDTLAYLSVGTTAGRTGENSDKKKWKSTKNDQNDIFKKATKPMAWIVFVVS
jgi:hypothetical protein